MDWTQSVPFLSDEDVQAARAQAQRMPETHTGEATERVVIVGFQTKTFSQMHAQALLCAALDKVMEENPEIYAYWVAMDERYQNQDQESAVLVRHGLQASVQRTLIDAGVSSPADTALTNPGDSFHKPQATT